MLTETQSISLSILRASVKKLGLHEIFNVEKLHFPMAYCGHDELIACGQSI